MFEETSIKKFFRKISNFKNWNVMNVPNVITLLRFFLIVPFFKNILKENYFKASEILIFSGITDFLDGFLARIMRQQTKFGEILDPIADKFTLVSIMISIGIKFKSVVPFMIILVCKELFMLIAGAFMLKKYKRTIKARWYGKFGTAFFYFSIIIIVLIKALWGIENKFLVDKLMVVTTLLMFHALLRYAIEFIGIVLNKGARIK